VISKHGSGTDTIDQEAARARGVEVRAAAGANADAVAEHALALMLACAKSVPQLDARMRAGQWDKATHKSLELNGRTLGLVGLGAIGQRFARMANAMAMRVIGFDPYARDLPASIEPVHLATLWQEADVISLHCPLTAENRDLLNAQTLAACKRGVIVVNTARGGLIDEDALLAAVRSGQVRAAGLDSFAVEPMAANHPFQAEPGIILSPHIGGVSSDAFVKMGLGAVRNARSVIEGVPPEAVA
jgi:D-3-phosphoglycerate dehydrogenase / 2-oxoglutarate reductase